MKQLMILLYTLGGLFITSHLKAQVVLEALEGTIPFTPSEKCLELVYDKHYGDGVHNYIYCAVQGPNGKKWLNLNLGAEYAKESSPHFNPEAVPTDYNDWKAFGNLYQWGRDSDGHEQVEYRQGSEYWEFRPINGVRTTKVAVGEQSNQMVSLIGSLTYADNLGTVWVNDPCPQGYHVATADDFIGIGSIDIVSGGPRTTSVFKSADLRVVTGPYVIYVNAVGYSTTISLVNINLGDGTSSLWLNHLLRRATSKVYNSLWEPVVLNRPEEGLVQGLGVLDRGAFTSNGLYEYGVIPIRTNSPAAMPIRCVQN